MAKTLVAIASVLLLSGGVALGAGWPALNAVDSDGNGQVDRIEWQKNAGKLKLDNAPTFEAMDANSNNIVDDDEWAAAEKLSAGYGARCREATSSWCKDAK